MAIANVKQMIEAELAGRVRTYSWRKTPSQATTAGIWFDLSMSPGNPKAKLWFDATPLTAQAIAQSSDGGIFHGADTSPYSQYLRNTMCMTVTATALPMQMILCDYLLYYPSIDESVTDPQEMDNTLTLPRYTDGAGVQVMAVTLASRTGGQTFRFSYTNQDGVSGRTSQTVIENSATAIGTIATAATATDVAVNPFIGLQEGDTGVRSIESVTMNGVDTGLFALLLVKPLAVTMIRGIDAVVEKDFLMHGATMPEIEDDAFLNYVCLPQGSLAATALIGDLKVIWN